MLLKTRIWVLKLSLILSSVTMGLWFAIRSTERVPFDSDAWIADGQTCPQLRIAMVADLRSKYRLVGMSDNEIQSLLGVPDATHVLSDEEWEYEYDLGPDHSAFGPDNGFLMLRFRRGRVIAVSRETG
jgi:hypothetical protein